MKGVLFFFSFVLVMFSSVCCSAISMQQAKHEMQEFGTMLGYAGMCAQNEYGITQKDPEGTQAGNKFGQKYKQFGTEAILSLQVGINVGLALYNQTRGANCENVFNAMINLYNEMGFTGNFYKAALKKHAGAQQGNAQNKVSKLKKKTFIIVDAKSGDPIGEAEELGLSFRDGVYVDLTPGLEEPNLWEIDDVYITTPYGTIGEPGDTFAFKTAEKSYPIPEDVRKITMKMLEDTIKAKKDFIY